MPRGQVLTIPTNTGVLTTTLSREQKASIALLNPNDGILYVHLNGPASNTPTMWDWKVPSQSYCQLPGPWESLGVYYEDQSGSGRTGEVNVYESDSQIAIPSFIAIGRAVQAAGSAVDISQGSQPSNPPASTVRLWADGSGNLHYLSSTGVDKTVIDSSNVASYVNPLIGAYALGGDLHGVVSNGTVGVQQGSAIDFRDPSGNYHHYLWPQAGEMIIPDALNGGTRWVNQSNSAEWMKINSSGFTVDVPMNTNNATMAAVTVASLTASGTIQALNIQATSIMGAGTLLGSNPGDISARRNDGTGVIFLGNQSHYLYFDGSSYILPAANLSLGGNFSPSGNIVAGGNIQAASAFALTAAGTSAYNALWWDGATTVISCGPSGFRWVNQVNSVAIMQLGTDWWLRNTANGGFAGTFFQPTSTSAGNGFTGPQRGGAPGNEQSAVAHLYVPGSVWCTNVQNISDRRLKQNLEVITSDTALGLILNPLANCYRYDWISPVENSPDAIQANFGFMADEMNKVCPEVIAMSDGEPSGVNYTQLVPILWSAVRNLNDRIAKLELTP